MYFCMYRTLFATYTFNNKQHTILSGLDRIMISTTIGLHISDWNVMHERLK